VSLVGRLGEKLSVYFNYDELADFPPNRRIRDVLQAYDDALCRRVDLVLTSSQGQRARRLRHNPHTHCVPNGVDHALFAQALSAQTQTPPELEGRQRPVAGFVGWLGHQLDVDLLLRLAQRYAGWTLALVGPDALPRSASYQALRAQPNVLFAGRRPLEELPRWLKAFDIALLPYDLSSHAQSIYPLKLHEYLAAGRSVLATAMPELRPFAGTIRLAPDAEAFLEQAPAAAADNAPEHQQARSTLARAHTWEQRLTLVHQALDEALARKQGGSPARAGARTAEALAGR
jgi:glycosyltransferase involved in cell wall biosynthesis